MGLASIDLAIMADRVRSLRAEARRDHVARSARQVYTRPSHSTASINGGGGHAAASALRDLVQASLNRNDR